MGQEKKAGYRTEFKRGKICVSYCMYEFGCLKKKHYSSTPTNIPEKLSTSPSVMP